jgi:hypothetical protein
MRDSEATQKTWHVSFVTLRDGDQTRPSAIRKAWRHRARAHCHPRRWRRNRPCSWSSVYESLLWRRRSFPVPSCRRPTQARPEGNRNRPGKPSPAWGGDGQQEATDGVGGADKGGESAPGRRTCRDLFITRAIANRAQNRAVGRREGKSGRSVARVQHGPYYGKVEAVSRDRHRFATNASRGRSSHIYRQRHCLKAWPSLRQHVIH